MKTYPLGYIPSPHDDRDYQLKNYMPRFRLSLVTEKLWPIPSDALNQGETGHCVGFAAAAWGNCDPIIDNLFASDGHNFYYQAKVIDGEPRQEDGTTIRSMAKVLKNDHFLTTYAFAATITEIKWWILNKGPVLMGTGWTMDMFKPNKDGVIRPTGQLAGGHATLWRGYSNGSFVIRNSWGISWGKHGDCFISEQDVMVLFRKYGMEAMSAVEIEHQPIPIPSPGPVVVNPKKKKRDDKKK